MQRSFFPKNKRQEPIFRKDPAWTMRNVSRTGLLTLRIHLGKPLMMTRKTNVRLFARAGRAIL